MKMRLSDAMQLGRVTCVLEAADWNSCALGCAANAIGLPREFESKIFGEGYIAHPRDTAIYAAWPWLGLPSGGDQERDYVQLSDPPDFGDEIWVRFDNLVCRGKMTMDELIDYVRLLESQLNVFPVEDCHTFCHTGP